MGARNQIADWHREVKGRASARNLLSYLLANAASTVMVVLAIMLGPAPAAESLLVGSFFGLLLFPVGTVLLAGAVCLSGDALARHSLLTLLVCMAYPLTFWLINRMIAALWIPKLPPFGSCPECGYDLRANVDRCPECGCIPENRPRVGVPW